MPTGPRIRSSVLAARDVLAAGRKKLRKQHERGSPGIQVCARLADLLDTVVLQLYREAICELGDEGLESEIALIPHGGYGRRDVAPYSDVDLMLLHSPATGARLTPLARRLLQDLGDAGLALGFSVRASREACRMALKDATVFTSLAESRFLGGSVQLYSRFARQLRHTAARRSRSLIDRISAARCDERRLAGETVYLLKPNVKRSPGGLRDLQLLRWIGFARYGEAEPDSLMRLGVLTCDDHTKLRKARAFLLRLRNEMHFHAGRSLDVLDRDEQLRLARLYGYPGSEGLLPVEQFMREYFEHTSGVQYAVNHFVATARNRRGLVSFFGPLFSHQVERDFRVGPVHIAATRSGLAKLRGNLAQVLRLMDLANRYDKPIDHATWVAIRDDMADRPEIELTAEATGRFLSLISQTGRLAGRLRRLHELGVLERIVPAMSHARGLVQFNEYHKFTVDEHSIRAVECATEFQTAPGPLGDVYRAIKDRRILHLALLIHDLGKGYPEDHSDVGARLAVDLAEALQLSPNESEILRFLVQQHLRMSHVAFREDLNDETVVVRFAREVGSPDVLQMLYVLSCADLAAVGPDVLNEWKLQLLTDLYRRTRSHLAGDTRSEEYDDRLQRRRAELRNLVGETPYRQWWEEQIAALPRGYLFHGTPRQIVDELERLRQVPLDDAVAWGRYLPERKAIEYTIGGHEEMTPGIFHKLTGALTSKGNQILSAEIHTLANNLVLDRFYVHDMDHNDQPPAERLEEVCQVLVKALRDPAGATPSFRRLWRARSSAAAADLNHLPTQVRFDNRTSDESTILTIFAYDRMGLLYSITRTLFELGLSVHVAKIATYLDQVVDVFYVTDQHGRKILDEQRIDEIRSRLQAAIDATSESLRAV